MVKNLTFDIRYDNELAHEYYGDGEKLTKKYIYPSCISNMSCTDKTSLENIYHDKHVQFPKEYDSTQTYPPIHFMSVTAEDDTSADDLRKVQVPHGLNVEILDFDE
ncbi:hypothetical protein ASPWEDRAFT_689083 [Aspergillus wentii DTO 134E9]|uniref:Uncharacterized protein n=1 Tax=Aspergillus wentii DTO 134E9 TaxID=1073089 RepID=A0A1L9R8J1_ASPWE|nr:uncharacterized protein ASPWEDRAFT_689083 [Aspergillus wentii DTO 134E9]OJJ31242.1 hypothetical protein ASPWEDRAFT_689083 [Aspergillus wentii DTO 134E9]